MVVCVCVCSNKCNGCQRKEQKCMLAVLGTLRVNNKDNAIVRGRWRNLTRMVDEQEGCEWMNVSSGTGSPG